MHGCLRWRCPVCETGYVEVACMSAQHSVARLAKTLFILLTRRGGTVLESEAVCISSTHTGTVTGASM